MLFSSRYGSRKLCVLRGGKGGRGGSKQRKKIQAVFFLNSANEGSSLSCGLAVCLSIIYFTIRNVEREEKSTFRRSVGKVCNFRTNSATSVIFTPSCSPCSSASLVYCNQCHTSTSPGTTPLRIRRTAGKSANIPPFFPFWKKVVRLN